MASVDGELSEESSKHGFRQWIGRARSVEKENGPLSQAVRDATSDMGKDSSIRVTEFDAEALLTAYDSISTQYP